MNKIDVFRVETKCGDGPYRGKTRIEFDCPGFEYDARHHPTPNVEPAFIKLYNGWGFIGSCEGYKFGFENVQHFLNWFDHGSALKWLKKKGFVLSVYKISARKVIKGEKQLIFCPDSAVCVDNILISDIKYFA